MKPVLLALTSLLLSAFAAGAAGNCLTDTSQTDFQAGEAVGVDLTSSSGNVLLGTSSGSGGNVDQENLTYTQYGDEFNTTQWLAQTFTPGASGSLTRVDVNFACAGCSGAPPAVTVSIRATSGGLPVGSDLASATIPTFSPAGATFKFYSANFATPATLTARTQYAIVVRLASAYAGGLALFTDSARGSFTGNDVYAGGGMLISTNSGGSWTPRILSGVGIDAVFITYMGGGGGGGGYLSSGTLTSSMKDSNPGTGSTNWSTLSWTNAAPTGTAIKFQAAASNSSTGTFTFVGPDGTAGSYFTTTNASLSQFNGNRYLKYRAYLSTSSSTATPTLNDATMCFSNVAAPDLSISNSDGVTTASPGGSVTYTITAMNAAGSGGVTGATVTDMFPASLTCSWTCTGAGGGTCAASGSGNINQLVNLPGGASITYSAACSIAPSASGTLTNTASIAPPAGITDPTPANNSVSDSDTLALMADVQVSVSDGVDSAQIGDVISYVINITNAGPGTANVNVLDALPAQLSGGSWVCSGTGGATCAKAMANNTTTLNTSATIPAAGKVTYVFTASVANNNSMDDFTNTATATLSSGTDPNPNNNSASDTDLLSLVFLNGFEGSQVPAMQVAVAVAGAESFAVQLGVDAGLVARLGPAPVTIARARSANGKNLFSVQLARLGNDIAMRSLTSAGDGIFSNVSPWRTVDLRQYVLGVGWQSASARGNDGYLDVAAGNSQMSAPALNVKESATQLQTAVENNIPWLVPIGP